MINKKKVDITRIFHTVGQGAFYSEQIQYGENDPFVMVYDCGSDTIPPVRQNGIIKSGSKLEKRINSDLGSNQVDILFISHFDEDHINGCELLDPKTIVLPFVNSTYRWILEIIGLLTGNPTLATLFLDPRSIFQNANIIRIMENGEDNRDQNIEEGSDNPVDLNNPDLFAGKLGKEIKIKSGTPIFAALGFQIWEYIPWNPNFSKFFAKFEEKLVGVPNLDIKELRKQPNGKYVISVFDELTAIYTSLHNKNDHSIQVYSGPNLQNTIRNWLSVYPGTYNGWRRRGWLYLNAPERISCIYFGDIKVEDKWLNDFYRFLGEDRLKNVGCIQIPHHGSVVNNGWKCLDSPHLERPIVCVISVGTNNRYGHPSAKVISNLLRVDADVVLVTENTSSMLIETGECIIK